MAELIGRFVGVLGEALAAGIGAAIVPSIGRCRSRCKFLIQVLGYVPLVAAYLMTFVVCALIVEKAESAWLSIGAGLLSAFCFFELARLMRKAFKQ